MRYTDVPASRARLLMLLPLFALLACSTPTTTVPLTHEAFVWQHAWTDSVRKAVTDHTLDGLIPLVAEVRWEGETPHWTPTQAPAGPREVALRIHALPDSLPLDALDPLIARARRAHPHATIQLDLDMPTRRLDAYASWLATTDDLIVTALPTWLESTSFRDIASAAGGFVLQVHWFDPSTPKGPLLRPDAVDVVARAAAHGVPFRVALPAYGHRVWMRDGLVVGLDSEQTRPVAGAQPHVVIADPHAIDMALDAWRDSHPAALTGVLWFRLPTEQDQLAWSDITLQAVRYDQPVEPALRVSYRRESDTTDHVCLHNDGTGSWHPQPVAIPGATYGGSQRGWLWSVARRALTPPLGALPLRPGHTACVGWVAHSGPAHAP